MYAAHRRTTRPSIGTGHVCVCARERATSGKVCRLAPSCETESAARPNHTAEGTQLQTVDDRSLPCLKSRKIENRALHHKTRDEAPYHPPWHASTLASLLGKEGFVDLRVYEVQRAPRPTLRAGFCHWLRDCFKSSQALTKKSAKVDRRCSV